MVPSVTRLPRPSFWGMIRSVYYLVVGASVGGSPQRGKPEAKIGAVFLTGVIIALVILRVVVASVALSCAGHNARLPWISELVFNVSWAVSGTPALIACLLIARLISAVLNYVVRSGTTDDSDLKRSLAEPVLIIVLGAIISLIVVSMCLPFFTVCRSM
jgi:type II secretory pathway component PulF